MPVALIRNILFQPFENGGHDIDGFREVTDLPRQRIYCLVSGIPDDLRNMIGLVEIFPLVEEKMIPKLLSVISGEDNQGRFVLAAAPEVVEDPSKVMVHFVHQPVIGSTGLTNFPIGCNSHGGIGFSRKEIGTFDQFVKHFQHRMLFLLPFQAFCTHGSRDIGGGIQRIVGFGRHPGRMGPKIGNMDEPVLLILGAEPFQERVRQKGCITVIPVIE